MFHELRPDNWKSRVVMLFTQNSSQVPKYSLPFHFIRLILFDSCTKNKRFILFFNLKK